MGDRTRTGDILIHSQPEQGAEPCKNQGLDAQAIPLTVPLTGPAAASCREVSHDSDLAHIVEVWDRLPEHVRRSVLLLIDATFPPRT